MDKSEDAFRTISEAAEDLDLPQHVLRFWETRFPQIRPMKRGGGRRYYRPDDVELLRAIKQLLYSEGYTIKGVQRILKERGVRAVLALHEGAAGGPAMPLEGLAPPLMDPRSPADATAPWNDLDDDPIDAAAFSGRADHPPILDASASMIPAARAPAQTTATGAQAPTTIRSPRRSAPEWTVEQHRRLTAIVAELAECRRILSAANI
jgi:DNA-binding transcriptional MerR regulator